MAAREKARAGRRRGWLAPLVGALVLVILGFAVGLVAGAAFEEPDLVMDHLAGRSVDVPLVRLSRESDTEVALETATGSVRPLGAPRDEVSVAPAPAEPPLASAAPGPAEPPLASAAPALAESPLASETPAVSAGPAAQAPLEVTPKPKPQAATHAARAGSFAIQVGAFAHSESADHLAGELRGVGIPGYVVREDGSAPFKVRVGPVETRADAERLALRLETEHRLPSWILTGDPR